MCFFHYTCTARRAISSLFFFDQDPGGKSPRRYPHEPDRRRSPSGKRLTFCVAAHRISPPRPCRTARRACLIDIDTWVSLIGFVSFEPRLFLFIHPLFPGQLSARSRAANSTPRHTTVCAATDRAVSFASSSTGTRIARGRSLRRLQNHPRRSLEGCYWERVELGEISYVTGWPRKTRLLNQTRAKRHLFAGSASEQIRQKIDTRSHRLSSSTGLPRSHTSESFLVLYLAGFKVAYLC